MTFYIIGFLIGIVTSLTGYPVYDFSTGVFSVKNLLILAICIIIAKLITIIKE